METVERDDQSSIQEEEEEEVCVFCTYAPNVDRSVDVLSRY